jgi:hypothetical protein
MKIAGLVGAVTPLFGSTAQYFRAYLTEEEPDFSVTVTPENLIFEQAELDEEARLEGFRRRQFTDPFLERAAIQRAFADRLMTFHTLLLHGSCIAVDGYAYLFTARSGTGKSTHTRLWCEVFCSRAQMVNDDKPFLRLRQEDVLACGSPWSGKHGLDTNVQLPLKGICILERGGENRIRRICVEEALPMLLHQSYLPDDTTQTLVEMLAARIPLWKMSCTKEAEAARVAFEAMSQP